MIQSYDCCSLLTVVTASKLSSKVIVARLYRSCRRPHSRLSVRGRPKCLLFVVISFSLSGSSENEAYLDKVLRRQGVLDRDGEGDDVILLSKRLLQQEVFRVQQHLAVAVLSENPEGLHIAVHLFIPLKVRSDGQVHLQPKVFLRYGGPLKELSVTVLSSAWS